MKAPTALVLGVIVGVAASSVALRWWQSGEQARWEAEVQELKQGLSRAQRAEAEAREAARAAKGNRDREPARAVPNHAPGPTPGNPTLAVPGPTPTPATATSNSAIMTYLGEAIAAPPTLDPKYSPQQLAAAFRGLCEARGVKVGKLGVDSTEFPFVLHGILEGENAASFFQQINAELRAVPGYAYGGAVSGKTNEGALHFSLHMTPSSTFPREQADAIRRRLMLRLQMIDAAWAEFVR